MWMAHGIVSVLLGEVANTPMRTQAREHRTRRSHMVIRILQMRSEASQTACCFLAGDCGQKTAWRPRQQGLQAIHHAVAKMGEIELSIRPFAP